jgi:cell fate (sporulation/competence/biofilm development) regulator YlbF (YheA/YmcA/DUF963 family)
MTGGIGPSGRDLARRAVGVLLVLTVVLASAPTGVAGGVDADRDPDPVRAVGDPSPVVSQQTPVNNSTVDRHQNPANETDDGDLSGVSAALSASLSQRLGDSSISLSRGQYDLAKDYVGPEYRQQLDRYFEVTEATPNESDDRLAERFNETSAAQGRLAERVAEFNETREEYRRAKQAGEQARAERLARELRQQADEIRETGGTVARDYSRISTEAGVDLSSATDALNETVEERLREAQEIQDREFTPTRLVVETRASDASFLDPVPLRGRLTSNGSALADRPIRLEIGAQVVETRTDADGNFSVGYRPVDQPLGSQRIDVLYLPRNESNLQRSNDSVTVTVAQVDPAVAVDVSPTVAGYNDTVRITGEVTAGGVAAPSTPLSVSVAGETLVENETTRDGRINETVRLPMRVTEGERAVTVAVGADNRSLARAEQRAVLNVTPTDADVFLNATRLNQSGSAIEQRTVLARGRLTTVEGVPIADQRIELRIDERTLGTVRTDETGRYETTVDIPTRYLPMSVGGEERVPITAAYDAEETGFGPTNTTARVLVQSELLAVVGRNFSVAESLAALLIVGSAVLLRVRYDQSVDRVADAPTGGPTGSGPDGDAGPAAVRSRTDVAGDLLDGGRVDEAVEFAYAAVRDRVGTAYDVPADRSTTHWEFLRACDGVVGDRFADLERLTQLYERAAYDSRGVPEADAVEAVSIAETVDRILEAGPASDDASDPASDDAAAGDGESEESVGSDGDADDPTTAAAPSDGERVDTND